MKYEKSLGDFEETIDNIETILEKLTIEEKKIVKKKQSTFSKIVELILGILIIANILGVIIAALIDINLAILLTAVLFTVIGTLGLVSVNPFKSGYYIFLMVPIVGIVMLVLTIQYRIGGVEEKAEVFSKMPTLGLTAFIIAGVLLLIQQIVYKITKSKNCKIALTAQCVIHKYHYSQDNDHAARTKQVCSVYNYYYAGRDILAQEDNYCNVGVPKLGDCAEILINDRDPYDIYRKNITQGLIPIIIGVAFIVLPIVAFYMMGR